MDSYFNTDPGRENPDQTFIPLADTICSRLRSRPHDCAIRFRAMGISNVMLLNKALQLTAHLAGFNIGHGTRVGVCLERSPVVPALLLALWRCGAVYVPLDPALPRERLFLMCESAHLDVVLTAPALRVHVERLPCSLQVLEDDGFTIDVDDMATVVAECSVESGDLAYILYTSGSSGTPKGVKISHANLAALFAAVMPLLNLAPGSKILGCANFSFDISFFELLAPLLCGGTLLLADAATFGSAPGLLRFLEDEHATVVQATPSLWRLLNAQPWTGSIDVAIATGEALSRDTADAILQHAPVLWNLYGPTECTIWSSAHRVGDDDLAETAPSVVSIGAALPGYSLLLEEANTPDGATDQELVIAGCGVGAGYCDERKSDAFEQRPFGRVYHTGDLCRRDTQGRLHYLGRGDNQVKHFGYRIELDEIELMLRQHMSVREAACLVKPAGNDMQSLLFACVAFRPGMPNRNKAAMNAWLATVLPPWMLPQRYYFLDTLPLSANGKLDRAALLALAAPVNAPHADGSLEAQVASVFCEVLDLANIGPCDSFLDAGGTSMLAATLVLTLNERLGSGITLRQALATPPTVNSIVQLLRHEVCASAAT